MIPDPEPSMIYKFSYRVKNFDTEDLRNVF